MEKPYVKHGRRFKYNTGARGVMVLAGVGCGKLLVWQYIDGRNWNGAVAAETYKGPVLKALRGARPGKRKFRVLEDNDPAGFKCRMGVDAKKASRIEASPFPKPQHINTRPSPMHITTAIFMHMHARMSEMQ